MERFEKMLYYLLSGYLVLMLFLYPFLVKITVHQEVVYTALPFLAWIVLSVYYLLRWSYHKLARPQTAVAKEGSLQDGR